MKKLTVFFLCLILVFSLVACSSNDSSDNELEVPESSIENENEDSQDVIESLDEEKNEVVEIQSEPLDLNIINNTNSIESDIEFVGKEYLITGIVDQAMEPSDGFNALVIIQPEVLAKGMAELYPLEINIWLTPAEFESIEGVSSVGKQINVNAKLTYIHRDTSDNPDLKGYPIQLEFGEYE